MKIRVPQKVSERGDRNQRRQFCHYLEILAEFLLTAPVGQPPTPKKCAQVFRNTRGVAQRA